MITVEQANEISRLAGLFRIEWIVDNTSGATECEAWRGQHEIDSLTQAGYEIKTISLVQ